VLIVAGPGAGADGGGDLSGGHVMGGAVAGGGHHVAVAALVDAAVGRAGLGERAAVVA
jgi:hypothetical protein